MATEDELRAQYDHYLQSRYQDYLAGAKTSGATLPAFSQLSTPSPPEQRVWGSALGQALLGVGDLAGVPYHLGGDLIGPYLAGLYNLPTTGAPPIHELPTVLGLPPLPDVEAFGERERAAQGVTGVSGARLAGGFLAGGGPGLVASAGRGLGRLIEPLGTKGLDQIVGRVLNRAAGEASGGPASEAIDTLKTAYYLPAVPGSRPTAGEAATPIGRAEFAGLQREVERTAPAPHATAYLNIHEGQEAARRAALQRIGKTTQELEQGLEQRGDLSGPVYAQAKSLTVPADTKLMAMFRTPAMKEAVEAATITAQNQQRPFKIIQPGRLVSVQTLHDIKMEFDELITKAVNAASQPTASGAVKSSARGLTEMRAHLLDWLDTHVPLYQKARALHAAASIKPNQMQLGQALESQLTSPLGTGERTGKFMQTVRDPSKTIEQSTGQPGKALTDIFSKPQMESVQAVGAELERQARFGRLARAGTPAARSLIQDELAYVELPHILKRAFVLINDVLGRTEAAGKGRAVLRLSEVMQSPAKTAMLMERATPQERMTLLNALKVIAENGRRVVQVGTASGGALRSPTLPSVPSRELPQPVPNEP